MLLGTVYPPKQPSESFPVGIDFTNDLATGETISSAVTTALRLSDGEDVSAEILTGVELIATPVVAKRVIAGDPGELYRMQITITTSGLNTYEHEVDIPVEEN
jgi:hypothetical protein